MPIFRREKKRVEAPMRANAHDAPRRKFISRLKRGEESRIC